MSIEDFRLKVFQSVAKNLSFTTASEELYVSQPAITKHIKELETLFQTRLFERHGAAPLTLTDAGKLLLEHSDRILKAYERLDYEMNLLHNKYSGNLRLGASTTIAQYLLPPFLARFIASFPHVNLTLLNGNSAEIENAWAEHRIDLGLVEGLHRSPHLDYEPFLRDELVAIVPTHSRLSEMLPDEITVERLCSIPLVLREKGSGTLDVIKEALENRGISLNDLKVVMHLGSTESIKLFLEKSGCMGIVSVRSITKELSSGIFRVIEIKDMPMHRDFCFVGSATRGLPLVFKQFMERTSIW